MKKILLALQYWEQDKDSAMELARMIADLEPKHSEIADFLFISRFDCGHSMKTIEHVSKKFNVYSWRCPRQGTGWPAGCNDLWFGTIEWAYHMIEAKKIPQYQAIFTFEADGVPLTKTWISDLITQWETANKDNKIFVAGHYVPPPHEHINGNSLYSCDLGFLGWLKKLGGVPARRGWDTFLAADFKRWGWADLPGIVSEHRSERQTSDDFNRHVSFGRVWHHGCKDNTMKRAARDVLFTTKAPAKVTPKIELVSSPVSGDLSVCITSFKRPGYLRRAIESCEKAGIKNISIFSMLPDPEIHRICANRKYSFLPVDLGCNELWLQAAYQSPTKRMIILHDDDMLAPGFGKAYDEIIRPAMDSGAGFASWRAHCISDDGKITPTEYYRGETGVRSVADIENFNATPGHLSLSPVVSVFDRQTLIQAVKESGEVLPFLHPGMTLGTEILVYLRHCNPNNRWLFVNQVLSYYGSHPGSGTVEAQNGGDAAMKVLIKGYDEARTHYRKNPKASPFPLPARHLLCYSPFKPGDEETATRIANAQKTWDFQFNLGRMIKFPVIAGDLRRSSLDLGDIREMFYLKDLIDYGMSKAMPEDVVVYANMDLAFTINVTELIDRTLRKSGGVCVGWRRNIKFNPQQFFSTVKNGTWDGGVDLVAVTPAWWSRHREMVPDMFVGATFWDYVFRIYAEQASRGTSYLDDGTYHFPHASLHSKIGLKTAAQRHNHAEARKFFLSRGMHSSAANL